VRASPYSSDRECLVVLEC